jgi:hypothetical protein
VDLPPTEPALKAVREESPDALRRRAETALALFGVPWIISKEQFVESFTKELVVARLAARHPGVLPRQGTRGRGIWWARADASMQPERILKTKGVTGTQSFSKDGRRLVYLHSGEGMSVLPLDTSDPDHPKPSKPELVQPATGAFHYGAFSPDGRWLAFASAEAGSYQVYVRPYPAVSSGGKWQISTVPGRFPVWSRNGHELFY